MEQPAATAAMVVVMIQGAGCVLRRIARGGDIVIVARTIMQIGMLVTVHLMQVRGPCVTWQACEDQQGDEQLKNQTHQDRMNLIQKLIPTSRK